MGGHLEVVRLLLEAGADKDGGGYGVLTGILGEGGGGCYSISLGPWGGGGGYYSISMEGSLGGYK